MALNDGLARFRLQQERNQAALSAIAATKAAASSSPTNSQHHPAPAPATSTKPPPAAVRFSDDIARQINDVDIGGNSAIAESLRNNAKVRFDGKRCSYKRTHGVKGKDGLLSLIRSFPDGLPASEVEDAYPAVLEDLQALKSSGGIYLLSVERDMIAYPNDPRSRMEVDAGLKKMFHEVKLPQDMVDIEKELRKNGKKPATDTAKRRAAEQIHGRQLEPEKARKKPRRITSRTKLTNAHLRGLFDLPVKSNATEAVIILYPDVAVQGMTMPACI